MVSPEELKEAVATFPTGVTLVTMRDGRDDIGTTVSAFCPVSLEPPLVLVSLAAGSYASEVLHRHDAFAVCVLTAAQRALAGRFAVGGRPGARLLLAYVPHRRGPHTQALIVEDGLAALECTTRQRVAAGDHALFIAEVTDVAYVRGDAAPLLRFRGRYRNLAP